MLNLQYLLATGIYVAGFLGMSTMLVRALASASEIEAIHMALPF